MADWGHAGEGLFLWIVCVCSYLCTALTLCVRVLGFSVYLCFWSVFVKVNNLKCVTWLSVWAACLLSFSVCLCDSFIFQVWAIWKMFCMQPQWTRASEWLQVVVFLCFVFVLTLCPYSLPWCLSLSSFFSHVCLHLSSLLLFPSLRSLSRWQAVLSHRNRFSSDRCGHLS